MATITVRVGREEKEISGLTRKTTCSDILQALLKDKQTTNSLIAEGSEESLSKDLDLTNAKNVREFAKNYVIVENWRGCEKPLPSQTRILAVWQAWGKEQCHVKFSLKKDKNIFFRENRHPQYEDKAANGYNNFINMMGHGQHHTQTDSAHFLHKLSPGQKKRIRRSIMQYQRAVLKQHAKDKTDGNNNTGKPSHSTIIGEKIVPSAGDRNSFSRQKSNELDKSTVTLSEEQFVDGVVTGPDCFLRHEGKSKFIRTALDKKEFNREHCTYRRPHHRRRSLMLDDSDGLSDQNVVLSPPHKHELHHYPYCRKSRRRSSSRQRKHNSRKHHGKVSKQSRRGRMRNNRYSTDSTTTSTGTASTASEIEGESHSEGEDADDEKSIMTEFATANFQQKIGQYPGSILKCAARYSSGNGSPSTATATDSSSGTTTCSETSNTSSFSGTSSSETSSSADLYNESFFAKRAAAAASAKAACAEKSKSGSGAAKLFKRVAGPSLTKPAQSLIGSFKKKRKAPQPPSASPFTTSSVIKSPPSSNDKVLSKNTVKLSSTPVVTNKKSVVCKTANSQNNSELTTTTDSSPTSAGSKISNTGVTPPENEPLCKAIRNDITKSTNELETPKLFEQLKQQVLSQDQVLQTKNNTTKSIDAEIERIEVQVHRWRTQTHGKNYVQDTYLSGLNDTKESTKINVNNNPPRQRSRQLSSSMSSPEWMNECENTALFAEYVEECERIVETQLRIEECKRRTDIILQNIQDEVWKASGDPNTTNQHNPLTAAVLGLVSGNDGADSSDDEDAQFQSLSVSTGKGNTPTFVATEKSKNESAEGTLEVERSRTELEANLYLNLRLSTELEEVDQLTCASQRLLQSKGETLLTLVRELAQSPEGIAVELWEEYGELLAAYDDEVLLQQYLASCAENDDASCKKDKKDVAVTKKSRTPMKHEIHFEHEIREIDPMSPTTTDALDHALSPWLWCEHCKHELHQQQRARLTSTDTPPMSPHWLSHSAFPTNFSELPLPSPSTIIEPPPSPFIKPVSSVTQLLPMPPIPDCNDSEYEDIQEKSKATGSIISTEDANSRGIVFRQHPTRRQGQDSQVPNSVQIKDLLSSARNSSANSTDDSGNASAGSTASFASSNSDSASIDTASRNSSCDGGSPRPPSISIESQDSAQSSPFFNNFNMKKSNEKMQFVFPPQKSSQDNSLKFLKGIRSPSKTNQTKNRISFKPSLPLKPGTIASAPASPAGYTRVPVSPGYDKGSAEQKKLLRRNSGRNKKAAPTIPEVFEKRATNFGKAGVKPHALPNHLSNFPKQPFMHSNNEIDKKQTAKLKNKHLKNCPSPLDLLPTSRVAPPRLRSPASAPCSPFVGSNAAKVRRQDPRRPNIQLLVNELKKTNVCANDVTSNTYDNDSDTGLSSLHSTDSVDKLNMYSETLV